MAGDDLGALKRQRAKFESFAAERRAELKQQAQAVQVRPRALTGETGKPWSVCRAPPRPGTLTDSTRALPPSMPRGAPWMASRVPRVPPPPAGLC